MWLDKLRCLMDLNLIIPNKFLQSKYWNFCSTEISVILKPYQLQSVHACEPLETFSGGFLTEWLF